MEPWPPIHGRLNLRRCQNCKAHVTPEFRRTCGDENGVVHRCPDCVTYRQLKGDGAATELATDGGQ